MNDRAEALAKLALRDVAAASGVAVREIVASRGDRETWLARHVWWWLARELGGASYPAIARLSRHRHMAVFTAIRKVDALVRSGTGDAFDLARRAIFVAQSRRSVAMARRRAA